MSLGPMTTPLMLAVPFDCCGAAKMPEAATSTAINAARKMSERFIVSVSCKKWDPFPDPSENKSAVHTVFLKFSVGLDAPGLDSVSLLVTHGVPAFPDRSGMSLAVNPRVAFQHAAKIAKIERALPCHPRKPRTESRIIENSSEFFCKRLGIAGAKREPAFP